VEKVDAIFRRVAVALDASAQSRQAMQVAAELAACLRVDLEGIFVEDINLIHLAGLPFAREIRLATMTQETINLERMEQELKSLARQEKLKLEQLAREKGIGCSFRTRRGQVKTELMEAVAEVDVLTLCRPGQYMPEKLRQRSTAHIPRAAAHPWPQARYRISVLFGNRQNETRTLQAAGSLADYLDVDIDVLITADAAAGKDELQKQAEVILEPQKQRVNYIRLPSDQVSDLVQATSSLNSQLLLVNSNNSLVTSGQLWQCLEQMSFPVLLVR